MSAWDHYFKVGVCDVGEQVYDIESILCDEYQNMREGFGANKGMRVNRYGKGEKQRVDLHGEFIHPFDPSKITPENMALHIKKLVWRAAGRYLEVSVQAFIVEDNRWIGRDDKATYEELKEDGELEIRLDDEWEDSDE